MSRNIMLIPTDTSVGLNSIILGIIHAMELKSIRFSIFKTIAQFYTNNDLLDKIIIAMRKNPRLLASEPLKMNYVKNLLSNNQKDSLMEEIIANFHKNAYTNEVVLVQGLIPVSEHQFAQSLNFEIAKTLSAEIVFLMSHDTNNPKKLKEQIKLISNSFGGMKNNNITGVIFNKLNAPIDEQGRICSNLFEILNKSSKAKTIKINQIELQNSSPLPVLGAVPWNFDLITTRAIDIAYHLNATIINRGDIKNRRVKSIIICTKNITHELEYFSYHSLLVVPSDLPEILIAACLATINGIEIGTVLITGGYEIDTGITNLCKIAFNTGLPVLMVKANTLQTYLNLHKLNLKVPIDDYERIEKVKKHIAAYIKADWIESLKNASVHNRIFSPPAFRYQLTELARKAGKRIVLPEGNEPRTIKAAAICAERGISTCVLLGKPDEINCIANLHAVKLGSGIEILDPEVVRENYVARLIELRKNKGMTEIIARKQIEDNVVLGTLMLEQNKVDGLVSGAVHTTANTIRPSLQLLKTAPGSSLVSSIFFMLLPEQVYIYGDCAINQDPTAEQLAEIAIQSANSAIAFGIEPRIAMISYSTGTSGTGIHVEKVRKATLIVQKKRQDLIIDGPLQYDAAVMIDVAKSKAPNSPVAGRANVFIFPDLNTGNTTYKAVQRTAGLVSIGPILQGMRKPVNDLSRGALVDDIVYTIALTAIQSLHQQ